MTTTSRGQSVTATVTAAPDRGVTSRWAGRYVWTPPGACPMSSLHGDDAVALLRKISEEYG